MTEMFRGYKHRTSPMPLCESSKINDRDVLFRNRGASTSTFIDRLNAQQAAIEKLIFQKQEVAAIQRGLRQTHINSEEIMQVERPVVSRMAEAKRKALANWVRALGSLSI